jgi:hypothetical protein
MSKKLVYNYTFDASAQTIEIAGLHKLRTLQMITNVTDNVIIYNFADASKGGTVTYNSTTDVTTITLTYNTTSMSDSDELQIFIDEQEQQMDVSESLIDPVHKFRVSSPENLIDTDFEYGLQPTKWETVELVNNIPSVYTKSPGVSIGLIQEINGSAGSDSITVTCGVAHELAIGQPIEVQGTDSRTANGKFIINAIPSTTSFVYKAKQVQSTTGNYKTAYTTIIPGAFFSGANLEFNLNEGINTNNQDPSTLTITTDYYHGLSTSTSLYITNTVGKKSISIAQTGATAPDGNSYVDVTNDTLYLPLHGLYTDQIIYLSPGTGGILPGTNTLPAEPSNSSTITAVYNAVETACESIKSTMGTDHSRIYMGYGNNTIIPWYTGSNYTITPYSGGDDQIQYLTYGEYPGSSTSYDYIYFYTSIGNFTSEYRWYPYDEGNTDLFTGNSVDLGQYFIRQQYNLSNAGNVIPPVSLANLGFNYISTPFVDQQFTDYIISIRQYPNSNVVSSTNRYRFAFLNTNTSFVNTSFYSGFTSYNITRQTKSGGWTYSWVGTYLYYTNVGSGFLKYTILLENTNWAGQYGSGNVNANWSTVNSEPSLKHYFSSNLGSSYHIEVLIGLDEDATVSRYGDSGSVLTHQQIVSNIVDQIIADVTPVPLAVGINTLRANVVNNNRITLKSNSGVTIDFTNTGKAPFLLETAQTYGIADDYYNVTGITSTTVSIASSSRLASRELTFTNNDVIFSDPYYYLKFDSGHGIKNGQKVVYDLVSGSTIAGIASGSTYYTIVVNNKYVQLAFSADDVLSGINSITGLPASSGSYKLTIPSISGRVSAAGTIALTDTSNVVQGFNTRFSSTYSSGDSFVVVGLGTYASYFNNQVASVVSDTSMTLVNNAGITTVGAEHFIDTKVYTRADGTFLHRPFDGGVDITAGTSPDSKIIRQTRKYFRYQSGKGIQCSLAINFNPYRPIRLLEASGTTVTATTEYSHGLSSGNSIKVKGASDSNYNGTFTLTAVDTFTFTYTALSAPASSPSTGFCEYTINGYENAVIRCGLFDDQNGFFFEYDGQDLYCVRRSSTQQLTGTANASYQSNKILGTNTRFADQLSIGDMIVIRGQSYKVTRVNGQDEIDIQPKYRGASNSGVVVTLTQDTKVSQSNWSLDHADGTGPSGYTLDINSIQMAYMDYSWYGAGKIRFGFKDTYGKVKYMHEFIHNNRQNEAYMRTGNVPARYEVANIGTPTFVPSLFHWGTSVIMDGGFDNDDSYLFTASGNALSFTNGDSDTATTNANSTLASIRTGSQTRDYYLQLSFATSDASKFTSGVQLYTADEKLNGQSVTYTAYFGGSFLVYIFLSSGFLPPAVYPSITSGTSVSIGAPASGGDEVDLTDLIPLISIRLAPSVDNNLIGSLGERDIINRMQLKLEEMGISVSHDSRISVILNGALSDLEYSNVGSPSLSQYISHVSGDTIQGGTTIYQFRASGGSIGTTGQRTVASETFDLSRLTDLGNSILGGDGVFPNGPDIVTICASVLDTAGVNKDSPYQVSSRISWSESQA